MYYLKKLFLLIKLDNCWMSSVPQLSNIFPMILHPVHLNHHRFAQLARFGLTGSARKLTHLFGRLGDFLPTLCRMLEFPDSSRWIAVRRSLGFLLRRTRVLSYGSQTSPLICSLPSLCHSPLNRRWVRHRKLKLQSTFIGCSIYFILFVHPKSSLLYFIMFILDGSFYCIFHTKNWTELTYNSNWFSLWML